MKITNLKLVNYRNYDNLELHFSDTLNLIYGNNGSGKSNIVEAIYFLSLTKSFRSNNDLNLIKKNSCASSVLGRICTDKKDITNYKIELSKEGKLVYIDFDKIPKLSDYISKVNIVLFNPLDTRVIMDAPSERRKMLDISITGIYSDYLMLLKTYNKVLKNRNAYLKQCYLKGDNNVEYLDILTRQLVDIGLQIYNFRTSYINLMNDYIYSIYENIFECGKLVVKYNSFFQGKDEKSLYNLFSKNYAREIAQGKTLYGIQHDDIEFVLDVFLIKEYGSVGQQKNAIIAYKLAEILVIKKIKDEYPILILDDLFSELDKEKINNIIGMLNKDVQTFITTTDIDMVQQGLVNACNLYYVDNGIVERKDDNE